MKIILASGSPRRKEILEQIGVTFEIHPAKGEELITKNVPAEVVAELSEQKANEVAALYPPDTLVIGADTIVSFDGRILGKPKDEADAFRMLQSLSGNTHQVFTGVTVLCRKDGARDSLTFTECTDVTMFPMTESEIKGYIATGEPMDKAGAYAVQGLFAKYIKGLNGDFYNVMGLPVARLFQELKELGIALT